MASHVALLHAPPLSISTQRFHATRICINGLKLTTTTATSSSSCFPCSITTQRGSCSSVIACASSNGRDPDSVDDEDVRKVERILEEKRRAALSARIASGEFTVKQKYGLTFGPKSFLIVSNPSIAKHILRDNSKAYSKGILAEILDFVMGKGLIPADGEIWRVRRRAIVPALHQKYVAAMIGLFGQATDRLCKKLDAAASDGEDVEMESLFSRLTLDVIGKAVFNYDFDSLSNDTGIVEAVYTVLREAEDRSVAPIPVWEIPIWKDISPRLRKVNAALKLINDTLDDLIAICKVMLSVV
ncbi:LUTEIN DEFICIENT 5 [Spatholobus suberectus]|nr:LUTEIN DEFICIENT 5 [Spatholobus suberectus]